MNVTEKLAKRKFTSPYTSYPEERIIKVNKRNINRYERRLGAVEANDELGAFVEGKESQEWCDYEYSLVAHLLEKYNAYETQVDEDALPDGVTFTRQ